MSRLRPWLPWIGGALVTALITAWLDPAGDGGLPGYLTLSGTGAALTWLAWRELARRDAPRALTAVLLVGLALRLGVGIALTQALPVFGYADEEGQRDPYVFQDARLRDRDAWALGRSEQPLLRAFVRPQESDQYGGLLYLSAAIYRYLSGGIHRPLMVILPAATAGALAAVFTWAFASMSFGQRAGLIAAWVAALYPDAVLLGASQMREPFVMCGLALGLYGYARARAGAARSGRTAVLVGAALTIFISPPAGLMMLILLAAAWLWQGGLRLSWSVAGVAGLAVLALGLTAIAWSAVQDVGGGNPLSVIGDWLLHGAQFQLVLLERGSGWVQRMFEITPDWMHLPLATLYGLTRPLLPAALADRTGAVLWQAVEIWRSTGWFALLPVLAYAPVAALAARKQRGLALYLSLAFWAAAALASFRAAGDDWDNPRYRAIFVPLMGAVAGWAWVHARQSGSRWLKRTYLAVIGMTVIFLQWYVGRYYGTPRLSLEATFAAMAAFVVLYFGGVALVERRKAGGLTGGRA